MVTEKGIDMIKKSEGEARGETWAKGEWRKLVKWGPEQTHT